MLDNFTILTKGGIVLWSIELAKLKGSPINTLIKKVLLEERSADNSFQYENYSLKWTFANEFDLIFIAVYQKFITLMYIDELLLVIKKKFISTYKDILVSIKNSADSIVVDKFKDFKFEVYLEKVEIRSKQNQGNQPRTFDKTEKGKMTIEQQIEKEKKDGTYKKNQKKRDEAQQKKANRVLSDTSSDDDDEDDQSNNNGAQEGDNDLNKEFEGMSFNGLPIKKKNNTPNKPSGYQKKEKTSTKKDKTSNQKEDRVWDDKTSKKEQLLLDRSKSNGNKGTSTLKEQIKIKKFNIDEELSSDDEDLTEDKPATGFMKYFNMLTGNKVITKEELSTVLQDFKNHLIKKNVALDIAEKLVDSIGASLVGKKLSTFQGINSIIKQNMEEVITRILTPKKNIDILREIQNVKGKRPYTIVFSGVNGVGKSTNLAKICYWLTANGNKVMMAACDTFRSGAVEQLKTHAERLGCELYERGYGQDAANIAGDAIEYARSTQHDVVLIDTTGRMQHNEPLMKALSKLVNQNNVDLVLFVGEALVGNDGVDQLTTFSKSLSLLANTTSQNVRTIDGIILTKFDTIDDKVGAAISMVYSTGHPILFLGTGQNYTDLKRMNVKSVVKSLLS
ncbi:signal recognition particle receptor alpha subunit [Tieghemostelium lacteum]|uniref:Signal recognition particle receptor alpha subunit n=1 Tax=Tieghemostelium lacteum TaxID=361077 RepID=A0A151ZKE9_TIELA|nr:signal recognition particle receptor alpha subunit [Tieghemostelium lacteum]|eukprot:KYQ94416.1 signal recognition particle receptor alpha subunit [Tieghemostelium lacteum]